MRNHTSTLGAAAVAAALSILLAACGADAQRAEPSTTIPVTTTTVLPTSTTMRTSSTTKTQTPPTTQPDAVMPSEEPQATLSEIEARAVSGDLQALAELALSGDVPFTASFGQGFSDPAELASYWESFEAPSIPEVILGLLDAGSTQTLAAYEDGTQVAIHVAPAVMGEDSTPADRDRLESIFGGETVAAWYGDGMYLGWRMGVDADGNWRFLVIGD